MLRLLRNRRVWLSVLVVGALVAAALWPETIPVETVDVRTGPLVVTIDEDGRTRVRDRFVVTAPVAGEVLRIEWRPGDRVEKGRTRLATIRAAAPMPLDSRTRAEGEAAVRAAESLVGRLTAERARLVPALDLARRELKRVEALAAGGAVAREEVERRETEVASATEAIRAAEFAVAGAEHELTVARARLAPSPAFGTTRDWVITSPVDGVVLARHRESQSVVPAGDVLLEIGDPTGLEIVSDMLSSDVVKIRPGSKVFIEEWGGPETLEGRVRRIEPAGFTKVSALGVEEQRVNVVIDFDPTTEAARTLGDNFRVEVRVVVWESPAVLQVPPGALFRQGDGWGAYVIDGDVARLRQVTIGERNATAAEVRSGLAAGDAAILYPPDTLVDGARVVRR
jgi:HlyD family secretion protein